MLVEEARKKLDALALEDVKELARRELLKRDQNTLADVCLTLMDREQLTEWAVPVVVNEEKETQPVKYGRLNGEALKRLFPTSTVEEDRLRIPLDDCVKLTNETFEQHGVRLVCEGYGGSSLLMGGWAPIPEEKEDEAVQPTGVSAGREEAKKE